MENIGLPTTARWQLAITDGVFPLEFHSAARAKLGRMNPRKPKKRKFNATFNLSVLWLIAGSTGAYLMYLGYVDPKYIEKDFHRVVGSFLLGASLSYILSLMRHFNLNSLFEERFDEFGDILRDAIKPEFSFEEDALDPYRNKYHLYHVTQIDGEFVWRYEVLDFTKGQPPHRLVADCWWTKPHSKDDVRYKVDVLPFDSRLCLRVKSMSQEPLRLDIFPAMGHGYLEGAGFACLVGFDKKELLCPSLLLKVPPFKSRQHETVPKELFKTLDDLWTSEFAKVVAHSVLPGSMRGRKSSEALRPEAFFEELKVATCASDEVYTHMLSEPPEDLGTISESACSYFDAVHEHILSGKIRKFVRIASRGSLVGEGEIQPKAAWILKTLNMLKASKGFYLAYKDLDHNSPLVTLHACLKGPKGTVFVWPTLTAGGHGRAFSVSDLEIAQAMILEHNREFDASIVLKRGNHLDKKNIQSFCEINNLLNSRDYMELMDFIRSRPE